MKAYKFNSHGGNSFTVTGKTLAFDIGFHKGRNSVYLSVDKKVNGAWEIYPLPEKQIIVNRYVVQMDKTDSGMYAFFLDRKFDPKTQYLAVIEFIKEEFGFIPALEGINYFPEISDEIV